MGNAFIVVNSIVCRVCELVIYIHCTCKNSIRINNVAKWQYFFSFCLRSRSKVTIGCINCPMTFKLIRNPLLQAPISEWSWKDSMNIVNALNRLGKAVSSKSWQSYCLAQESALTRISWLWYSISIGVVGRSNGIITYIWKGYLIGGRVLLHITPWTLSTTSSAIFELLMSGITISLQVRLLSFDDVWYCTLSFERNLTLSLCGVKLWYQVTYNVDVG